MNRLKLLQFLFVLAILLAVVFGIGLLVPDMKDNQLGRIGLWCGLISQFLLAASMFLEIKRNKKGQDS
jgi:type IV secretory pathway VirB2 component (pilin)